MMDFTRLEYIKNINAGSDWAYEKYPIKAYFQLNFREAVGTDAHAFNLPKGALVILSQKPSAKDRYLTHVVELANNGSEDKPQWEPSEWGIFRWVKVHWVADFSNVNSIPLDQTVMKADWGWQDTRAKLLTSANLMSQWNNIENLRTHLAGVFH